VSTPASKIEVLLLISVLASLNFLDSGWPQSYVVGSSTAWVLISFRDGKMIREQWFESRDEALEAAGLEE
jgi:hypothetical protein